MGLIDTAKEAVKLVDQANNLDLYKRLVDLQLEAVEMVEQLKIKDEKIKQLEEALSLQGKLVYRDSAYYLVAKEGHFDDGPFCTKCWDVDHIKCRFVRAPETDEGREWVQCQRCKLPFRSEQITKDIRSLDSPDL